MKKWPVADPGDMMHPVVIQNLVIGSPANITPVGPIQNWITFLECYASIKHVRGIDVIQSGQTTAELYATITIYYFPGIGPDMRVIGDNGNTYVIQSIENPEPMNVLLVLNCVALGRNVTQ